MGPIKVVNVLMLLCAEIFFSCSACTSLERDFYACAQNSAHLILFLLLLFVFFNVYVKFLVYKFCKHSCLGNQQAAGGIKKIDE